MLRGPQNGERGDKRGDRRDRGHGLKCDILEAGAGHFDFV